MEVLDRLDSRLTAELVARRWRRLGTRRFVGGNHVVEMLPPSEEDRVTVFFGRCARPGDPSMLAECTRVTLKDGDALDRFLLRLGPARAPVTGVS